MTAITAEKVNELRQKTGAGMMDCKKALTEVNGDMEKAVDALRKRGLAAAAKKSGRVASEGVVSSYIHAGGSVGVLVEVNCETDFVAKTDHFLALVKDICLHIAAQKPQYVSIEEVPADLVAREKEIAIDQAKSSGKPAAVLEKIADGKIQKFYQDICLMEQGFVKDPDKAVKTLLTEAIAKIGENIKVRRFVRYELGEGIEKKTGDFAAEVAALQA
ncbi:MAG: translation elongation factor Ts [Bdellovibrionales bacterium]|nr:translation elongation factor Ts [Bdellovibrionales bacterium]